VRSDTKEPQPIDPAGVWIPITELLRTFVKPSSPAAILRIGTENDYVDMIARAVAVYETYSDVNGFALIQGITPVSQYTLLDGVRMDGSTYIDCVPRLLTHNVLFEALMDRLSYELHWNIWARSTTLFPQ
jgi:hypothetical protein